MPKIRYETSGFQAEKQSLIPHIEDVISEYTAQGYQLNSRGIAYRLEGQGIIKKTEKKFQQVEDVVKEGRMNGLVDWDAVPVDAARTLHELATWEGVEDRIKWAARTHRIDKYALQPNRLEVISEKEGMLGVIGGTCREFEVPYRTTTGYDSVAGKRELALRIMSRTAMGRTLIAYHESTGDGMFPEQALRECLDEPGFEEWRDLLEVEQARSADQGTVLLYLGDHDPSGYEMEEGLLYDLTEYGATNFWTVRVAIGCELTCQANPSLLHSAPAKGQDTRYPRYVEHHRTTEAWEVESMEPSELNQLLRASIIKELDIPAWNEAITTEKSQREYLLKLAATDHEWLEDLL